MKNIYGLLVLFVACLRISAALAQNTTTDGKLSYVKNSGICETTPGVEQMSGYVEIEKDAYMWFWFFEARHNKETAPLTLWLNGGPGCSSLLGLFKENGPCTVNPDSRSTSLNPYSWNNESNLLYIDQPINAGFSHGPTRLEANNTEQTAAQLWTAFQALFDSSEIGIFKDRELFLATESYGAKFGTHTIQYFNENNQKIIAGELEGHIVQFTGLIVGNGRHDPLTLARSYIDFAADAPGYGPLQNETTISMMKENFYKEDGCGPNLLKCNELEPSPESAKVCYKAFKQCQKHVYRLAVGDRDARDLRQQAHSTSPFPPLYYEGYIQLEDVIKRIGAVKGKYDQCNDDVKATFAKTGDFGRSDLPTLASLANARLPILIWAGDADIKCNWLGVLEAMVTMQWYGNENLKQAAFKNISVNGRPAAEFKDVDYFTFARVYGAGHALPAFQPQAAFEIFRHFSKYKNLRGLEDKEEPSPLPTDNENKQIHRKRHGH